jgi:DNA-binding ferritin-like protein (Dps family)
MRGMIETLKHMIREKAEYKASRELLVSLSDEYQFVFKEIEKYMFCQMVDESMLSVLMNTLESFAVAAGDGRSVFSITGEDVGLFCDNLIKEFQVNTWVGRQREQLNKKIREKIKDNK